MKNLGIAIIIGAVVLAPLLLAGWLLGFIGGIGGSLIHLLLLAAPAVAVVGVSVGVILIVADRRK